LGAHLSQRCDDCRENFFCIFPVQIIYLLHAPVQCVPILNFIEFEHNIYNIKRKVIALMEAEINDAGVRDDLGIFFRRLGEVCFTPGASEDDYPGHASSLAVAGKSGAVFFSDRSGEPGALLTIFATGSHGSSVIEFLIPSQACMRRKLPTSSAACRSGTMTSERRREQPINPAFCYPLYSPFPG
jgi:hypothetical protein